MTVSLTNILLALLTALIGACLTVILFMKSEMAKGRKEDREASEKKDAEQDQAINELRRDWNNFRAQMPETYVLRADFIRELTVFQKKIDDLSIKTDGTNVKLAAIAEDVARILALQEKRKEDKHA